MKKIRKMIIIPILLLILFMPCVVNAAGANISISSASTGVVGNNLKVTVTISSSQPLGAWDFDVKYNSEYLSLSSVGNSDDCGNSTSCHGNVENSSTKSKSYTFTFKVKKSGSTSISVGSTVYLYDESKSTPSSSKNISLKTQAEIEASYSANANLKSLGVTGYTIDPTFNKDTLEYELEVENNVEKVTITAAKEDGTATISGTGEKTLTEGNNKFDIVVTAQKGNSKTYTININRKELNPITVNANGKNYTIVRKADQLPTYKAFIPGEISYEGETIPALVNEGINYTLIGLKDSEGNIKTFIYDNGVKDEYFELTSGELTILPKSADAIKGLTKKEIDIKGRTITAYSLSESNSYIIKGVNVYNGEESYYMYDKVNGIFIAYDKTNIELLMKKYSMFKIGIISLGIVVVLLIVLLILTKITGKKNKKNKEELFAEETVIEEIKVEDDKVEEEPKEEIREEIKEDIEEEEKKEEVLDEEPKLSKKAQKKLVKEEKRKKRLQDEEEKTKALAALTEEVLAEVKKDTEEKVEEKEEVEEDEVDDPLNDDDNFVDFWETREYKIKGKKDK